MIDLTSLQLQIDYTNQAYILLLLIPIVATIVGIARHIVGIKSLGIYAPIVLTFAFYALGLNGVYGHYSDVVTGIRYGLIAMAVVVAGSMLGTLLTKRTRMHYYPKIAMSISLVAILLLAVIWIADTLGREGFSTTSSLAFILIASVAEQFTSTLAKKNFKTAFVLTIETITISLFSYVLIAWPSLQQFIITYPYAILLTFVVNYFVGKYRGLRIREFYRFRQILNSNQQED